MAAIKELRARFEWRYPRLAGAPGINIFGDWAATTGLAQAARRLAVALADAGFDLSLGTIRSGAPRDMRRVPDVLRHVREGRSHVVDLWMVNVNEFCLLYTSRCV